MVIEQVLTKNMDICIESVNVYYVSRMRLKKKTIHSNKNFALYHSLF